MKKAKPTDKELLQLMKWYAEENIAFNKGKTFEDFQTTTQLNWASVFSIEQIAENSKQVSDEVKNRYCHEKLHGRITSRLCHVPRQMKHVSFI